MKKQQKIDRAEKIRVDVQKSTDSSKSKKDRNALGQFATPRNLADQLLEYAAGQMRTQDIRFFDPAFGTGSFYTAFLKAFDCEDGLGFEIDPDYFSGALKAWKSHPRLKLVNTDFTTENPANYKLPNLLVCNPPYSRHHHISQDKKRSIQKRIHDTVGIDVSGLAGLHFYFILLCHKWLEEDGLSVWLVPSELTEVNYGKALREYLLQMVNLERIHFFEHSEVQFADALVSSCVISFRKAAPTTKSVEITVGDFEKPQSSFFVSRQYLGQHNKWSKHLLQSSQTAGENVANVDTKIGDIFTIKRGIATGNNSFFVLTKDEAEKLKVPKKYLQNILPPIRYINSDVITMDSDGYLATDKKLVVLNIDLEMEEIKRKYPSLYDYLLSGIKNDVDKSYLTSKRQPWYSQEKRQPPKYFVRYMTRERKNGESHPVFIKNDSDAIATNSYLMLYEKPAELFNTVDTVKIWQQLSNGINSSIYKYGRTYGGGLVKFEPNELREVPLGIA